MGLYGICGFYVDDATLELRLQIIQEHKLIPSTFVVNGREYAVRQQVGTIKALAGINHFGEAQT